MGAFSIFSGNTEYRVGFELGDYPTKGFSILKLDANSGDTNPMNGHAAGSEIRPYTILSVPIYIY